MAPNQENIEAQLCAYVDDDMTAEERVEIEKHLAANPNHRRLLKELGQTRTLLRRLPRAKAPLDLVESFQSQLERSALLNNEPPRRPRDLMHTNRWPQILSIAAIVLLSAGLVGVIYKVLPASKPHRELVLNGSSTPPALATSDEGAATGLSESEKALRPDAHPSTDGLASGRERLERSFAGTGGAAGPSKMSTTGGGSAGDGAGVSSSTVAGEKRDNGKNADAAKPLAGKSLADASDVRAVQQEMAKRSDPSGDPANAAGTLNVTSSASGGITNVGLGTKTAVAAEDVPVVVVVNARDAGAASGDVAAYFLQNNIQYNPIADAPASPGAANQSITLNGISVAADKMPLQRKDVAVKKEAPGDRPPDDWYLDAEGHIHNRKADEVALASKAKEGLSPSGPATQPSDPIATVSQQGAPVVGGTSAAGTLALNAPSMPATTTQPTSALAFANNYSNGIANNGAVSGTNTYAYRAMMSRRQVVDLNLRLSQREGQTSEVRSDAYINRPEANALAENGSNLDRTGIRGTVTNNGAMAGTNMVTGNTTSPAVQNQAELIAPPRRGGVNDQPTASPAPTPSANESVAAQPTDQQGRFGGSGGMAKRATGYAQQPEQQELQTRRAPASQPPPAPGEALTQQSDNQAAKTGLAPDPASLRSAAQPVTPPAQPTLQSAGLQTASAQAMQSTVLDPDEQPREVLIVVNPNLNGAIPPALPAAASPTASPATAPSTTRPAPTNLLPPSR